MPRSADTRQTISAISYPKPIWRYVLLFQSWSQLASWSFIVLLSLLLMSVLFTELREIQTMWPVLIGVALGSLVSPFMVVPAQLRVAPASIGAVHSMARMLEHMRYVERYRNPHTIIFRQRLPRLLRWKEGEVVVCRSPTCIVLDGPRTVLGRVRAQLIAGKSN